MARPFVVVLLYVKVSSMGMWYMFFMRHIRYESIASGYGCILRSVELEVQNQRTCIRFYRGHEFQISLPSTLCIHSQELCLGFPKSSTVFVPWSHQWVGRDGHKIGRDWQRCSTCRRYLDWVFSRSARCSLGFPGYLICVCVVQTVSTRSVDWIFAPIWNGVLLGFGLWCKVKSISKPESIRW